MRRCRKEDVKQIGSGLEGEFGTFGSDWEYIAIVAINGFNSDLVLYQAGSKGRNYSYYSIQDVLGVDTKKRANSRYKGLKAESIHTLHQTSIYHQLVFTTKYS